jgi:transposase
VIPLPSRSQVWIATGPSDMRRGVERLALQVQERLQRDSHAGDLFLFRCRRGGVIK